MPKAAQALHNSILRQSRKTIEIYNRTRVLKSQRKAVFQEKFKLRNYAEDRLKKYFEFNHKHNK